MEFQHIPFSQYAPYMDGAHVDHMADGLIDPDLKTTGSPVHMGDPWNPPQMQRYLTDYSKSSYWGYSQVETMVPTSLVRRHDGVMPLPPAMLQRQPSPSYTHPSSTCSSALTPPQESDGYQPNSPPTPADTPVLSPFLTHHENWKSNSPDFHYTGLADACVEPLEVNPIQEQGPAILEDSSPKFDISRGFSMSSDDTSSNIEQWPPTEGYQSHHPLSPVGFTQEVKDEICIPEGNVVYPPIESDEEASSADEVELPVVKEEEDDEYTPNKRHRRTASASNRGTRGRKRSGAAQATPPMKRTKFESREIPRSQPTDKARLQGAQGTFPCKECSAIGFKDESGLMNHIKKQHTRPFICVFHFAGCSSTFASKNEWKRHCASQHLLLNYWLCQQDQCARVVNDSGAPAKSTSPSHHRTHSSHSHIVCAPSLPNGAIFNRKDLYTQHLRRMHIPSHVKKQVKLKKTVPEWEDEVRHHQEDAHQIRCELPTHMECPAPGCTSQFDGVNAWDERMEHVAKHLDRAASGAEPPISFGGDHDRTLMDWATRSDVSIVIKSDRGKWEQYNPLKPNGGPKKEVVTDDEEDAEGEIDE